VGYLASKNNVQKYKVYAIVIHMFDPNFMNNLKQALRDNTWPIELTNQNYMAHLLDHIIFFWDKQSKPIFIGKSCTQEVVKK
jgi:hypothetical protein